MDRKAGAYRRILEGNKDTNQVQFGASVGKEEDRRRYNIVKEAIEHRAPSVVFHKLYGNDFQCGVPSACKMVTAEEFDFPIKIMRLLPHVCDDAPVLELDCKQQKKEAMSVENSIIVEQPASLSRAARAVLGVLALVFALAMLSHFKAASASPTESGLALVRQSDGNVWIALRANLARILAVVMARLPALAPFE